MMIKTLRKVNQTMRMQIFKFSKYWVVILWAVIGTIYFLPCLIYASERLGLDVVNTKKTIGVTIEFKSRWYPLASSNTWYGKLIISSEVSPTVIYCEINWINPWNCDQVWVSRNKVWEVKEDSGIFATVQQFPWGAIGIVKDEVTKTPDGKLGIVRGLGIGFSAENLNILRDISTISFETWPVSQ